MQRHTRLMCVFLCFIIFCICTPSFVFATDNTSIDTSHSSDGYFTINYSDKNYSKIKVGVIYNKTTTYYDYTFGEESSYAFEQGDGNYTIKIYQNIKGILYKCIVSQNVNVTLENNLSPYLVSTREIEFSKDDDVSKKAFEICKNITDTYAKVEALCEYISANITYDYEFANEVINGTIKIHRPNASEILKNKKGICYDYAVLFATMCRSQSIPCTIKMGYHNDIYHSWNKVYIDNDWYIVDFMGYYSNTFIT